MSQVGLLSSMPSEDTTANWGFAEKKGEKSTIFDSWMVQARTGQILIATFAVSSVIALTAGILMVTGGLALPAIIALGVGLGGATLSGGGICVHNALKSYQSYQKAGMVDTSQAEHMQYWKDNTPSPTEMIPTQHCADTFKWREELIKTAQHNIVISGNYCGGEAFDRTLDLIEARMDEKPDLKVVLISSPKFIKNKTVKQVDVDGNEVRIPVENKTKLAALQEKFPDRFSLVESPDVWMVGTSAKKVTNHTKYFGIDYGKYYILGGTGIQDGYVYGVDNPLSLIDFDGLKMLEIGLQNIGKRFLSFTELAQSIVQNPISSSSDIIRDLCLQFQGNDLEGEWLPEFDNTDITDGFVLSEENSDFNRAIDVIHKENKKVLKEALQILTQVQGISEKPIELQRIEKQLIKIIFTIDDYNTTVNSFRNYVRASLLSTGEEEALRDLLSHVHKLAKNNAELSMSAALLESLQKRSHKEIKECAGSILSTFFEELKIFSRNVGGSLQSFSSGSGAEGLLAVFMARNFRDMDFVFKSSDEENSAGRRLFLQMLTLGYRWEQYNAAYSKQSDIPVYSPNEVPYFGAFIPQGCEAIEPIPVQEDDTPLIRLMKEPMIDSREVSTCVERFDGHRQVDKSGEIQLFFSGPEQANGTSEFCAEALKQINEAEEEIVINHMYIHPTSDLRDALIWAAKRGVKVKIITCGVHPTCPNAHRIFGPRNKYNYVSIFRALPKDKRENVEVYEYTQDQTTLHKKVMVFDRKRVLAGSSNFGYKSLVTTSDHEVNFLANAPHFAEETYRVCELDIKHSKRVEDPTQISTYERLKAANHRLNAPLIG